MILEEGRAGGGGISLLLLLKTSSEPATGSTSSSSSSSRDMETANCERLIRLRLSRTALGFGVDPTDGIILSTVAFVDVVGLFFDEADIVFLVRSPKARRCCCFVGSGDFICKSNFRLYFNILKTMIF